MKDKQKSLKDIDFLTELTSSEQEKINGGAGKSLTSPQETDPNTPSTSSFAPATEPPPPPENPWYPDTRPQSYLTF
jgi:hypothetical protein